MSNQPLSGSWNFRDVAHSTSGAVRPGLLFRSGELTNLAPQGLETLAQHRIGDVADLRSPAEVSAQGPDRVPHGVRVHLLPFAATMTTTADEAAPHEHTLERLLDQGAGSSGSESIGSDTAARYMVEEYRRFPQLPGAQRAVRQIVALLAERRPVLAHCFAGKDRTGFTVGVALSAVGVKPETVMVDYLLSNSATDAVRDGLIEQIRLRRPELNDQALAVLHSRISDDVLGVRPEYLDAAMTSIDENYGSLTGFLEASGIDAAEVRRLHSALLD